MIPKKIHYCWFGGNPLPELAVKCIESWKKFCPDYEIIEWNESNFDLNYNDYVKEAYAAKKWAFITDVVRLHALVNYGGIYMDTDVEVLKPLDDFLDLEAFLGFERANAISTGIMAAEKGQKLFVELLNDYKGEHFLKDDGTLNTVTNVVRVTKSCLKYGLVLDNTKQMVNGSILFPKDYFCPKDLVTKKLFITENTYTIHHFDGSWMSPSDQLYKKLLVKYNKFMPNLFARKFARMMAEWRVNGFFKGTKILFKKAKKKKK